MRKPKTVTKDIQNWETKLATLQTDLEKAKGREVNAIEKKKKVVLLAKTGDEQAGKKLAQAREGELRATLEASEYNEAIEQCQGKLQGLETELKASKLEAGRALLAEYGKKLEGEFAPLIDKAVAEVIAGIQKIQEPSEELRKNLQGLGFPESNFDTDVNKAIGAFIRASFFPYAKSYFEFHPHKHEWNRKLVETITKARLEHLADQAIRDRARDEARYVAMPVLDSSNMRVVPQAEALMVEETRKQMREDAAQLKAGVA